MIKTKNPGDARVFVETKYYKWNSEQQSGSV